MWIINDKIWKTLPTNKMPFIFIFCCFLEIKLFFFTLLLNFIKYLLKSIFTTYMHIINIYNISQYLKLKLLLYISKYIPTILIIFFTSNEMSLYNYTLSSIRLFGIIILLLFSVFIMARKWECVTWRNTRLNDSMKIFCRDCLFFFKCGYFAVSILLK